MIFVSSSTDKYWLSYQRDPILYFSVCIMSIYFWILTIYFVRLSSKIIGRVIFNWQKCAYQVLKPGRLNFFILYKSLVLRQIVKLKSFYKDKQKVPIAYPIIHTVWITFYKLLPFIPGTKIIDLYDYGKHS